jgi:hypothetical protein
MGTHPKWVQTPITTNHSGFAALSLSCWGSRRVLTGTLCSLLISSAVLKNKKNCQECRKDKKE